MLYTMIKKYYSLGIYNETDLDDFVEVGFITLQQKEEIMK